MSYSLTIVPDVFDQSTWEEIATDDVCETLVKRWQDFPHTARIYCGNVSLQTDVTPGCQADIDALQEMKGPFWCVVYPAFGVDLIYYVYAIIAIVAIVALTTKPKIPNVTSRNQQSQSPNNQLSGRTNQARLNGRIPDIFGTVRSTPDLLAVPYSIFVDHIEFEYCYMCIGRGTYAITPDTVRDGTTPVSNINGESVEIFGPNTSPNTGDAPQLRIGGAITRPVISAVRSKSVNGQVLIGPNESSSIKNYNNLVSFAVPNKIVAISGNPVSFSTDYHVGDVINVYTTPTSAGSNQSGYELFAGPRSSGFTFASVATPRNVTLHSSGTIEFAPGFLASLYAGYTDTSGSFDVFVPTYGPGLFIEIASLTINIGGTDYDFSGKYLSAGDSGDIITLTTPQLVNAAWSVVTTTASGVATFANTSNLLEDFSGQYTITGVADKILTLSNPANYLGVGSWLWAQVANNYNGGDSSWGTDGSVVTIGIGDIGGGWVGPFVLDVTTMNQVIANFVALNGMYSDDGTTQRRVDVSLQMGVTPCAIDGTATGPEQFFSATVQGSDSVQSERAVTLIANVTVSGRYKVRARRITKKDLTFTGTVVDEVKWRDVYASSPVGNIAFGDITTVHAVTQATQQALSVSERQLNMIVQRKIKHWNGSSFPSTLVATNKAADIISHICLDPKIGNRQLSEVNFTNIYDTQADIESYFGIAAAGEFSYTFDNDNLSFEETLSTVASAVFSTAHRRGRVIELLFEKLTTDSVLLFNHRNKIPGTESRTETFGLPDNNDGIEYDYVSPIDDAIVTYYIPTNRTAVNPKKFESIGVRSDNQAYLHAWREWNKIKFKVRTISFDATQESEIISTYSRILIADNTRPDIQDGEVIGQVGLVLTLSQPVSMIAGAAYVIFLQLPTGQTQVIDIAPGVDSYNIILSEAPAAPLKLATDDVARTVYQVVKAADKNNGNNKGFLLIEKAPQGNSINTLTAINYDPRYYANDQDF